MARALVTGGAGFIGSHLVDHLIKRGHRITVVDNLSSGRRAFVNPAARFYRLDIQSPRIKNLFKKGRFDYVFHLAAQKNIRVSTKDPVFDARVNILGSLNILENCRKYKVKKFVFASTTGVYGEAKEVPTKETYPVRPVSPYTVAKLAVERYLDYYNEYYQLPSAVLRFANVYGPRQDASGEGGVVAIFAKKVVANRAPTINGDGRQTRDFLFVDDAVSAALVALRKSVIGTYNIGTGRETSINDLAIKTIKISRSSIKPKHGPAIPGDQRRSALNYSKAKRIMGWQPKTSLVKGLEKTINWFNKN
jgi:UDP-glucose 4-epimerase